MQPGLRKTKIKWPLENMAYNWKVKYCAVGDCSQMKHESFLQQPVNNFATMMVIDSNALLTFEHVLWTLLETCATL